jgi:hypothetical protein
MKNSPGSAPLCHDKSMEAFLALLVPTAEKFTFQLLSDRPGGSVTSTGNHGAPDGISAAHGASWKVTDHKEARPLL